MGASCCRGGMGRGGGERGRRDKLFWGYIVVEGGDNLLGPVVNKGLK